jgi:glycosyltransferase involved in cell wall biosynthesis
MDADMIHVRSEQDPVVSVVLTTYNHESYLDQALRSAALQETSFPIEILVGEDCSTDQTRRVAEQLCAEFPDRIRLFCYPQNVGGNENFNFLWTRARGKYVAWLEGDDFWTDQHKLQAQVEAMERRPDAALCFHNTAVLHELTGEYGGVHPGMDEAAVLPFSHLIFSNRVMTCSVMYRRGLVSELPLWVYPLKLGDWPLHLLHAAHGPAVFLPETMATYRMHPAGGWSNKDYAFRLRGTIETIEAVKRNLPKELAYLCECSISNFSKELELVELREEAQRLRQGVTIYGSEPS